MIILRSFSEAEAIPSQYGANICWYLPSKEVHLNRLGLDVQLGNEELDGAALDEDGDEDDEERRRQKDFLERSPLVKNGDQRKTDGSSQASVGENELFLK